MHPVNVHQTQLRDVDSGKDWPLITMIPDPST